MGTPYIDERWVKDHGVLGQTDTLEPELRWYRCRLRTLLVLGAIVAAMVAFALAGQVRLERILVRLESLGANVLIKSNACWITHCDGGTSRLLREGKDDFRYLSRHFFLSLDLSGSNMSDHDVPQLAAIGGLSAVDLRDCLVSEEGVKSLRQALPNCQIDWAPPTTPVR